jgi:hypothetical protein
VLRPATTEELDALRVAASACDASLDRALLRIGVLAPAELDDIRLLLGSGSVELRDGCNGDGHRRIEVVADGVCRGWLHHDGRVQHASSFAA